MVQSTVAAQPPNLKPSVRRALASADFASLRDHCRSDPAHVVRSCLAWRDELAASERDRGLARWAMIAGRVAGLLRTCRQLSQALELARAGERMTPRLRAEEALAALGVGNVPLARELLEGDERLGRALRPIVAALSGNTVDLRGAPKSTALGRLWAGAKAVRELRAGRITAAHRAAAETDHPWFASVAERALHARSGKLSPSDAIELVQHVLEPPSHASPPGSGGGGARSGRSEALARALLRDLVALSPEQEIDLRGLRRAVGPRVFHDWFVLKFGALGSDPAALTRWVRGVAPELVPRSLAATYYLWRSFLRIAAQRESAAKDVEMAARLGADPIEVARAAFLIALRAGPEPARLERATEELASLLARAGGELEACVVRVGAAREAAPDFYHGASPAAVERWLSRARGAAQRLGADRPAAEYEIDCLEAAAIAPSKPERAAELAQRAARAIPEQAAAWRLRIALAQGPAGATDEALEQLIEEAHAATADPAFRESARSLRMKAGAVAPFAELAWERVEASTLIGEAFRHFVERGPVERGPVESRPESIERWCDAWRRAVEHAAELRPGVRDAFDAGVVAYALSRFGTTGAGRILVEICRAKTALAPTALATLLGDDDGLSRNEVVEIAQQAAAQASRGAAPLASARHPLPVLASAYMRLGHGDRAAHLIRGVAPSVDASVLRAAMRRLEDPPDALPAAWDEIHDALHPTVCLSQLLRGKVDPHRVALDYQRGRSGSSEGDDDFEDEGFEQRALDPEDLAERVDDGLAELSEMAKPFRLDMDKVRELPPHQLMRFLLQLDDLEAGTAAGLAAARRLGAEFGLARESERPPKMNEPTSAKDKNRRKRERKARKTGKGKK